ncbi:S-layer protein domain-containing protein [Methanimicrococcus blatticola]|uniref:S-layer protein (TIGR01567 family) n=1 Tax=Methanimicrococcus blatticola TaxID=91560 RepID=A0A484F658_9EURY|nr:S-layer protein domain-containing protein [Methanimicrococcus blatticola]MBZ3935857.1 hypothetical protein [Methanimicrococcus blatticola]MCC2508022.1 hypothetical protein [Methanimicrococcus blatticola]TDQ68895.1 S-layer protein (TIGR01567 family) [Methanimicrococcus blatticola]
MQMKHLLVALLVLLAFTGMAAAADSVEIRSTIVHYDELSTQITPADWAGLWYDLDDDTSTEILYLNTPTNKGDTDIVYETIPVFQNYEYDGWANTSTGSTENYGYAVIGFFAEPYVALGKKDVTSFDLSGGDTPAIKATKIAKLVIDDDEKYTLKTGATLELGSGYSIIVDQIDVDGNKAYLKLMKDGKELNSSIVNTNETGLNSSTWMFDLTVLGEKNMQVMRVHVKDVFQGTESSLVEIDGLWMVDYQNAIEVKSDDKFGKFECITADNYKLEFEAEEITLSADSDIELGKGIFIKTEKNFDKTDAMGLDKFYVYKEYTEAGTYEIRSSVFNYSTSTGGSIALKNGNVESELNYTTFAAFFYDMDNGVDTEVLAFDGDGSIIDEGDLTYNTTPKAVSYEYDWTFNDTVNGGIEDAPEFYFIMGFFGEKYVPFNIVDVNGHNTDLKPEKMAKLIIDDDEKYTLKTGATLELGEGYTIIVDQIDVDGNKAYLKFLKDGKEINSSIVNTKDNTSNWILRQNITNEKNVQVLRIHVKDVFQGTQDSLVEIDGFWLMDYQNANELKSDDKFGILEYDGSSDVTNTYDYEYTIGNTVYLLPYDTSVLEFSSGTKITWASDMDKQIANNMYLKTADSTSNKLAYFYVNAEVGDGGNVTDPDPVPSEGGNETEPPVTPPTEGGNNTTDPEPPKDDEPSWFKKNMWLIIGVIVLIIIIAGAAYYFMVYKKQA